MALFDGFTNLMNKTLRARELQAQRSVHAYFAQFDDATLARLGMKREDLKKGGSVNYFM